MRTLEAITILAVYLAFLYALTWLSHPFYVREPFHVLSTYRGIAWCLLKCSDVDEETFQRCLESLPSVVGVYYVTSNISIARVEGYGLRCITLGVKGRLNPKIWLIIVGG